MEHNHVARDIKPPGECPACDEGRRPVPDAGEPISLDRSATITVDVTGRADGIARLHFAYVDGSIVPELGLELTLRLVGIDNAQPIGPD